MLINIYVVLRRGSIMSLGFTGISFITKSTGMIFLLWLGVGYLNLNFKIFEVIFVLKTFLQTQILMP